MKSKKEEKKNKKETMSFSEDDLFSCPELRHMWHTMSFSCINQVPTRTLVAFVASGGSLRIGYAFRTHSSLTVYYDDNSSDEKTRLLKKAFPPICAMFLVFQEMTTDKTESQLTNEDVEFEWLTPTVLEKIHYKLQSQRSLWGETFDRVLDSIHDLSVEQLSKVLTYVRKGLPDLDVAIVVKEDEESINN